MKIKNITFNKKKYYIGISVLIVVAVIFFYSNTNTLNEKGVVENFDISTVSSLKKLVFSFPNMDKEMCETFPKFILSSLEGLDGIIDASFEYEGHVLTVYYAAELTSQNEILNDQTYAWIGTEFISEESMNISIIREIYENRDKNNNLEMPEKHMSNINYAENLEIINFQDFPPIVGAKWLSKNKNNVKIIEMGPKEEYGEGHIKGAVSIEIEDIQTDILGVAQQVLSREDFETLMKKKGMSNEDRIVIYSSKSLTHASRLYWTLKYYGHKDVAIFDGGKDLIDKKDLITDKTEIDFSNYFAKSNQDIIVDSDYILNKIGDSNVIILDVRNEQEFNQGHIAGSINIDWTNLLNDDGTLKNKKELEEIFKNVDGNKEIIIYCVSGTRASYAWFVLSEVLGYPEVKLFDGSMIEWNFKKLPLEK